MEALTRKSGFLLLFALSARTFLKGVRVKLRCPMSELAIPLATAVAVELHIELCPATRNPIAEKKGIYTVNFIEGGYINLQAVPKSCMREKGKVLLTDFILNNVDKVEAFETVIRHARSSLYGVMAVKIEDEVKKYLDSKSIKRHSFL
ncbi:MAG: hypothetical protein J7L55_04560 [Desulfurococcales archaeon]|nr:hypothetical protein [Desulfurococcales archaeon]